MSWDQLLDIYRSGAQLAQLEDDTSPADCVDDGTPLRSGPSGELFCPFCGTKPK